MRNVKVEKVKDIKLFLILGDARSGTTFLASEMSKALPVVIPPESRFVTWVLINFHPNEILSKDKIKTFMGFLSQDQKFLDWEMSIDEVYGAIDCGRTTAISLLKDIFNIYRRKYNTDFYLFGIKKNLIFQFEIIKKWFPDISIIWVVRDGRSVYASKKKSTESISGRKFVNNVWDAVLTWVDKNSMLSQIQSQNRRSVIKVHYEYVVSNVENQVNEIGRFLGIESNSSVTSKYKVPQRYSKIHFNVSKSPLVSRVDSWNDELNSHEIKLFEWLAGDVLLYHGYRISNNKRKPKYLGLILLKSLLTLKKSRRWLGFRWHEYKKDIKLTS